MMGSISYFLSTCNNLEMLKLIHAPLVISRDMLLPPMLSSTESCSYGCFGAIDHACKLFDQIPQPNAFIWTGLIHAHVENSLLEEVVVLFHRMRKESIPPLNFTVSLVLKALARRSVAQEELTVHGFVLKYELDSDLNVQNSVIDMYSRFGEVDVAHQVFDGAQWVNR